jgi:hypothetical protein
MKNEAKELKDILSRLVDLKDHKDKYGKDTLYLNEQPILWNIARKTLKACEGNSDTEANVNLACAIVRSKPMFQKGNVIKTEAKYFECICADKKTAIFGEITIWDKDNKRVSYEKIFAVDQIVTDNFKYELIKHHEIRVVPDSDGGL